MTATRQFSYNEEDEDLMPLQAFLSTRRWKRARGRRIPGAGCSAVDDAALGERPEVPGRRLLSVWKRRMFPSQMSLDEGGRLEERRLAYVGVTRAMQKLNATYAELPSVW
ncbi:3'-5' exonuclease [Escherichia coli]